MALSPREAADLLARHGLSPRKALGQHFVVDPNTVRRIARLAGVGPGDHVVEIGPGLGALTRALAETGASVTAVEVDRDLVPVLEAELGPLGVRVVSADARDADWPALLAGSEPWHLVANLPYNIGTSLVLGVLERAPTVERLLVMVQLEAGERLVARPGTKAYGAVSVKVAWYGAAEIVGRVPPTVFLPRPKVDSALVRVARRPAPSGVDRDAVFALLDAGFAHRRKMLRGALAGRATPDDLVAAGIRPEQRAEELELDAWVRLAATLAPAGGAAS